MTLRTLLHSLILSGAALILAALLCARPAYAIDVVVIQADSAAIDLLPSIDPHRSSGDEIQITTAPGADGIVRRIAVKAKAVGGQPDWIVFALLAAQFAVGFLMPHIRRDTPMEGLVAWHVSLGTAILFFLFVRVLWRLARPVPMDETLPTWQRHLAALTHGMLYLLVLVMVVLGWSAAGFYDWTVRLFGAVTLPRRMWEDLRYAIDPTIAAVSTLTIVLTAGLLGLLLPTALHALRMDPKIAAGPIERFSAFSRQLKGGLSVGRAELLQQRCGSLPSLLLR